MARIRTVKPTFWSHPITGKLSDAAKCMAIALLNLADDEGYFYADPATVRSFCRPFDDDSTITRGCLAELSRTTYIQVSEHPERGPVGRITSFREHQKIDRPKYSEIKPYFIGDDSTNNRRTIDDASLLEGKGKEEGTECAPPLKSDELIFAIAHAYPKLSHLRELEIPKNVQDEIIRAIGTDGADNVLAGVRAYAAQLDDPKYATRPVDFFHEFKYRPFLENATPERKWRPVQ